MKKALLTAMAMAFAAPALADDLGREMDHAAHRTGAVTKDAAKDVRDGAKDVADNTEDALHTDRGLHKTKRHMKKAGRHAKKTARHTVHHD